MNDLQQPISTDQALRLLTESRRRELLHRVAEEGDRTSVNRLATTIRGEESQKSTEIERPTDGRLELHHVDLPLLQEADVVVRDTAAETVEPGPNFQAVYSLLQLIDNHTFST